MKKITIFFLSCFIMSSVSAISFKGLVTNACKIVKNMRKNTILSAKRTNFQRMVSTLSSKKNNNSMHNIKDRMCSKNKFEKEMDTFKKRDDFQKLVTLN